MSALSVLRAGITRNLSPCNSSHTDWTPHPALSTCCFVLFHMCSRTLLTGLPVPALISSWLSRCPAEACLVKRKRGAGRWGRGRPTVCENGGVASRRARGLSFCRWSAESECMKCGAAWMVCSSVTHLNRSADIALVAGGNRKRWIVATENMQAGDIILNSDHIGRMAVAPREGDAHPLGALPVGTLVNSVESEPGRGAQYIRAAGTCGVLLRKVNGTAIIQLPSKRQMQVLDTCIATVGRVSNVDHNKRVIGKAGRNRWLGKRPNSGLWQRKGGWAGRKIRPLPPMKSYVKLPSAAAQN
ncbi:hypothetical protein QTO34_001498 [Cnephaeus nilssonii]|uniref:Mitochondrial ribosomal protein L2 n=1 Tax=Cnephaeus nilssonii TaxID=3371016 RepID=A0AA40HWZ4_CNENI|nr:hypothetical protein QTO34_001498 [Eptesicus nilssonii]